MKTADEHPETRFCVLLNVIDQLDTNDDIGAATRNVTRIGPHVAGASVPDENVKDTTPFPINKSKLLDQSGNMFPLYPRHRQSRISNQSWPSLSH